MKSFMSMSHATAEEVSVSTVTSWCLRRAASRPPSTQCRDLKAFSPASEPVLASTLTLRCVTQGAMGRPCSRGVERFTSLLPGQARMELSAF